MLELLSRYIPDSGFYRLGKRFVKYQGIYLWRRLGKESEAAWAGAISFPFGRKWLLSKIPLKSEQAIFLHWSLDPQVVRGGEADPWETEAPFQS